VAKEAGAELICGSSLKAALDRDWDQQIQKDEALALVLNVLQAVETWVQTLQQEDAQLAQSPLSVAQQVKVQDVEVNENGKASLIKGVAKDRRISVEDGQMRHGRKSRSVRVDGYKRHVLHDLDTGLIRTVGLTPANMPEASVTEAISVDLDRQEVSLKELHIDRAYLSSHLVRERGDDLEVYCPRDAHQCVYLSTSGKEASRRLDPRILASLRPGGYAEKPVPARSVEQAIPRAATLDWGGKTGRARASGRW